MVSVARASAGLQRVLWVDCGGALLVGAGMVVFADWLSRLYRLPGPLFGIVAAANLVYGFFALFVASRRIRPTGLVAALAVANALWGAVCLALAAAVFGRASGLGLAHLGGEAAVVLVLARTEWRHRAALARP